MSGSVNESAFDWKLRNQTLQRSGIPLLMGILNVTPDSFSDGGDHNGVEAAVEHGRQLAEDGADVIDIGGESTRPGSAPVSLDEELQRTIPVIQRLADSVVVPLSIDTTKAEVARQALDAGAQIVNDISGGTFDQQMLTVCAEADAGICLMHIQGTPQTMQDDPQYEDVRADVHKFLSARIAAAIAAGNEIERICLDPGIGFGKTAEHNLTLMQSVGWFHEEFQRPLLIGHSRKRFLSRVLGRSVDERLSGTIGVSVALAAQGADILRIHDVRAVRDALVAWRAILPTE